MAPLGALSQSLVTAEASPPLGWQINGLWRFDDQAALAVLLGSLGFEKATVVFEQPPAT
jgi:hypothetical protein